MRGRLRLSYLSSLRRLGCNQEDTVPPQGQHRKGVNDGLQGNQPTSMLTPTQAVLFAATPRASEGNKLNEPGARPGFRQSYQYTLLYLDKVSVSPSLRALRLKNQTEV